MLGHHRVVDARGSQFDHSEELSHHVVEYRCTGRRRGCYQQHQLACRCEVFSKIIVVPNVLILDKLSRECGGGTIDDNGCQQRSMKMNMSSTHAVFYIIKQFDKIATRSNDTQP